MRKIPILSFFTGGGLFDLGMELAGFQIVWTNEINPAFADMYSSAMTEWRIRTRRKPIDSAITCREDISKIQIKKVGQAAFGSRNPDIFGVIGGPPCPDFSNGGRHAGASGENGKLTSTFIQAILELSPDFFVMENVAGLFRFSKHRNFLEKQIWALRNSGKYAVDLRIMNALELGIAQSRERLFVVGCRKAIAEQAIQHRLRIDECGWFFWPNIPKYANVSKLNWPSTTEFGGNPVKPDDIPIELTVFGVFDGLANPVEIPNGAEYFVPYSNKFWERREGDVSGKSFKRLHRFRYSPTAWYGNQEVHLHPWEPRRISLREAMRIQSVPDDYILPEAKSLSAKFKMIGNGVPCRMAELLGIQLRRFLKLGMGQ